MKIAIIGTAGRREDGSKMSKELYKKMYNRALIEISQLMELTIDDGDTVDLVSGGAAWADHIAVSIFLSKSANSLTLHLPAEFSHEYCRFVENPNDKWCSGCTSNHYHDLFARKMGRSTMQGIARAALKGAKIYTYGGFRERNKVVGQVGALIAFTWGEGDKPKDGGTSYTWGKSTARTRIHIPLGNL